MVGLGWLGLVEFDVDRPRSRATDGHSVNPTRKTKNHPVSRHKRSLFGRAMAQMTTVVRYGPGHDTHHRLHWLSALLFSFWVIEAHCEPRSLLVSQRARGARNENKIVM